MANNDLTGLSRCLVRVKRRKRSAAIAYSWAVYAALAVAVIAVIALIAYLLVPARAQAAAPIRTVSGTVEYVADGDTIHVVTPEQTKLKVRLYGLDAQETAKFNTSGQMSKPGQPYGETAKAALQEKVQGKNVVLQIMDVDRYRRLVGIIWIDDRCVNLEMVREGHAEAMPAYLRPPYRQVFMDNQRAAQSDRIGIWSLPHYESPSVFRRRIGSE